MAFMALITAMVLCVRSRDSLLPVSVLGYRSYSRLLDLRAEKNCAHLHQLLRTVAIAFFAAYSGGEYGMPLAYRLHAVINVFISSLFAVKLSS